MSTVRSSLRAIAALLVVLGGLAISAARADAACMPEVSLFAVNYSFSASAKVRTYGTTAHVQRLVRTVDPACSLDSYRTASTAVHESFGFGVAHVEAIVAQYGLPPFGFQHKLEYCVGTQCQVFPWLGMPTTCTSATNGYETIRMENPSHGTNGLWRFTIDCANGTSFGNGAQLTTAYFSGFSLEEASRNAASSSLGDHYGLQSYNQSGSGWSAWAGVYCQYDSDSSFYINAPSATEVMFVSGPNPPGYGCLVV